MRRILLVLVFTFPVLAQSNPLRQAVAEGAKSIAWKIQTSGVSICCCERGHGWRNYDSSEYHVKYRDILLFADFEGQRLTNVRMAEPECPIGDARVVIATTEQSLDFLLEHLNGEEQIVAAIAMHDHPRVIPELIELARHDKRTRVRNQSLFWLGQRAGEKAAGELRRAVDEDPEDEVREHAVFAISQLPAERAVPILSDLVKNHKRPAVRKRAMFWLTQTGDPRALQLIEDILGVR
jgi:hypothetical protein